MNRINFLRFLDDIWMIEHASKHKCSAGLNWPVYLNYSKTTTWMTTHPGGHKRTPPPQKKCKELQATIHSIKISVHDLTIGNRLSKKGIYGK